MMTQEIRQVILQELPQIIKEDEEIHQFILQLASGVFAERADTESQFDRLLNELRREREANEKRWQANEKRWQEQGELWKKNQEELRQDREVQAQHWKEQEQLWEENRQSWKENQQRWEENQQTINKTLERLEKVDKRIDQTIGALGARWGIQSEEAFRNGLQAILEESFGVEVLRINEWDDTGMVFGRPDQVELDVIIQNGQLIICELKSSMSKSDMYTFERKVRYYEKTHQRTCQRMLVISPMVDTLAKKVAQPLGIEVYTHSSDVKL